jgi:hypothetical protein
MFHCRHPTHPQQECWSSKPHTTSRKDAPQGPGVSEPSKQDRGGWKVRPATGAICPRPAIVCASQAVFSACRAAAELEFLGARSVHRVRFRYNPLLGAWAGL